MTNDHRHTKYCFACGESIDHRAEICPKCGVRQTGSPGQGQSKRVTAALFAILLGGVGAHKFYLGQTGLGVLYLVFFWTGIPMLVGLVEGILFLTKSDGEFDAIYAVQRTH